MTSGVVRFLVLAGSLLAAGSAQAQVSKDLKSSNASVQLPSPGATETVAVASIANAGMYAAYLVSATSDVAASVEFRDASKGTQALSDVTVINYETLYMDAKGVHLHLSGLKRPLQEGETVAITLKTDAGDLVEIAATVKKP